MRASMQQLRHSAICALLCALFPLACIFDSDECGPDDCASETGDSSEFRSASLWQGCAEDPNEPGSLVDDWGCDGKPGEGLACAMSAHPVTKATLTICVPQVADPEVNATCWSLPSPPTSGETFPEKGLCLPSCAPGTCEPGYVCSVDGFCAVPW